MSCPLDIQGIYLMLRMHLIQRKGCYIIVSIYPIIMPLCTLFGNKGLREERWQKILKLFSRYILKKADGIQVDGTRTQTILAQRLKNSQKIYLKPMIPPDSENF